MPHRLVRIQEWHELKTQSTNHCCVCVEIIELAVLASRFAKHKYRRKIDSAEVAATEVLDDAAF